MTLVLDTSMTLAWIFPGEGSAAADRVLDRIVAGGARVPSLWRLEVANALQTAVRRRRIDAAFRDAALLDLQALPITVDAETDRRAWTDTLRLAERYQLTLYDAAYLELALRQRLALASLDQALCAAARHAGVDVTGP